MRSPILHGYFLSAHQDTSILICFLRKVVYLISTHVVFFIVVIGDAPISGDCAKRSLCSLREKVIHLVASKTIDELSA